MNQNVLLLTVFIIFLIILYLIINLFLGNNMLSENFEVDNNNYYGLVDCEKYPYLCKLEYPVEYSDYLYNRPLPKQKLNQLERYYNRLQRRQQRGN
jgi:hypothetical protein